MKQDLLLFIKTLNQRSDTNPIRKETAEITDASSFLAHKRDLVKVACNYRSLSSISLIHQGRENHYFKYT